MTEPDPPSLELLILEGRSLAERLDVLEGLMGDLVAQVRVNWAAHENERRELRTWLEGRLSNVASRAR